MQTKRLKSDDPQRVYHDAPLIPGRTLDQAHFEYEKRDRKENPDYLNDIHWKREFKWSNCA